MVSPFSLHTKTVHKLVGSKEASDDLAEHRLDHACISMRRRPASKFGMTLASSTTRSFHILTCGVVCVALCGVVWCVVSGAASTFSWPRQEGSRAPATSLPGVWSWNSLTRKLHCFPFQGRYDEISNDDDEIVDQTVVLTVPQIMDTKMKIFLVNVGQGESGTMTMSFLKIRLLGFAGHGFRDGPSEVDPTFTFSTSFFICPFFLSLFSIFSMLLLLF